MFFYDPKYKKTLPYYDTFPLVLPLERIPGGFAGINFHYLRPVKARFTLLERLQRFSTRGEKLIVEIVLMSVIIELKIYLL